MKVGELFFTLGVVPDSSWGRVQGMVNKLRASMGGLGGVGGALGGGGGAMPVSGLAGGGFNKGKPVNWATATGSPFINDSSGGRGGGGGGGGGGRGRGGKKDKGWFGNLRDSINDLNLFRRALYGTFAVQAVRQVSDLADTYTKLQNRLRSLTGSQEEAEEQYQRGRNVARETRSDLETTVESFVRVKNATRDMGMSYDDTWTFITRVQKAIKMSGASTMEAAQGMRQLTQGLSKGKLDGDEFRTIAESLPDVLRILGEASGKTEGEIRKMSEEGKLTRKFIIDAFTKMGDEIDKKFGDTIPTISEQFQEFKNQMVDTFGRFAKAVNLVRIAKGVFAAFAVVLKVVIGVFTVLFTLINAVVDGFIFLWNAAKSGSDAALAVLIGIGATLATVLIPSLIFIGTLLWTTILPAIGAIAIAAAAALGPYLLIAAAVAAIAYGIIKLVKHWDAVKAAAERAANAIADGISSAFEYISNLPVIAELIWLVRKLEDLTNLNITGSMGEGQGGVLGMTQKQSQQQVNGEAFVNAPDAAGKQVLVGDTTVTIYANNAEEARQKFDAEMLKRQNRHAAAALSR